MATYACADLHGHIDIYYQIKEYLQPKDVVYYLGDAGDRGPSSWELIKAIANDRQFVYLKGNHEALLVQSAKDYLCPKGFGSQDYMILMNVGGSQTFDDWEQDKEREKWIKCLDYLPTYKIYKNKNEKTILLSHAGFTPFWDQCQKQIAIPSNYDLIWDRDHFNEKWDTKHFKNYLVVHGHTPSKDIHKILNLPESTFKNGAYWYCDNHKICIDTCTYKSGIACLLNLDTLEEKLFYTKE